MLNELANFLSEAFSGILLAVAPARVAANWNAPVEAERTVEKPVAKAAAAIRAGSPTRPVTEPRRLSINEQWGYLSDVIKDAAVRAEEVTRCHASAALQLDLAQYALTSLVDELSAVMDVGGRRRRATVHVLGVPSSRTFDEAIAA
jgi:hypothetical protein